LQGDLGNSLGFNRVEKTVNSMRWPQNLVQDSSLPNHIISKFPGVFCVELHLDEKTKKEWLMDLRGIGKVKTEIITTKPKDYKTD
jgi:hypothetical protein